MSISNTKAEKKIITKTINPQGGISTDPGPASAGTPPGAKMASKSDMVSAPKAPSGIGNLTAVQVKAIILQIAFSETKSNPGAVDVNNYCGKYQFTAQNLVDLGYIKADYYEQYGQGSNTGAVHIAGAWTGKNNIQDLGDFLAAEPLQDNAMFQLLNSYYESLNRLNGIKPGDTVSTIAGMLCVAHALGPSAAKKWRDTAVGEDVYKTPGGSYFGIGQYAVDVLSIPSSIR